MAYTGCILMDRLEKLFIGQVWKSEDKRSIAYFPEGEYAITGLGFATEMKPWGTSHINICYKSVKDGKWASNGKRKLWSGFVDLHEFRTTLKPTGITLREAIE